MLGTVQAMCLPKMSTLVSEHEGQRRICTHGHTSVAGEGQWFLDDREDVCVSFFPAAMIQKQLKGFMLSGVPEGWSPSYQEDMTAWAQGHCHTASAVQKQNWKSKWRQAIKAQGLPYDVLSPERSQCGERTEHGGVLRFHNFPRQHHQHQRPSVQTQEAVRHFLHSNHNSIHRVSTKDRK